MVEIVKTGVPGLDSIFDSKGIIANSNVLVSGEPGAGKSILAMEFIYNGAKDFKEKGMFISSEQTIEKIKEVSSSLGMDFEALEKKGLISMKKVNISRGGEMLPDAIIREIRAKKIQRIVLDSITPFEFLAADLREYRLKMLAFLEMLGKQKATLLATAEKRLTNFDQIEFDPADFLFDGLILMGRQRRTVNFQRVLTVVKMRGTKHSEELHPIEISDKGLSIMTIK